MMPKPCSAHLDRSIAYRLADFANEYIAPDDNDACRQAMFDALYHTPSIHSGTVDERLDANSLLLSSWATTSINDLQVCIFWAKKLQTKNLRIRAFAPPAVSMGRQYVRPGRSP
jgi:hypothetical protein